MGIRSWFRKPWRVFKGFGMVPAGAARGPDGAPSTGRDGGLGAGGRGSSKGGEEMPEKGEERRIIKIRSN